MAITKRPQAHKSNPDTKLENFIQGAPDGQKTAPGTEAPEDAGSVQITLRLSAEQIRRLNKAARQQGIPRASYIKRAIALQLRADESNNS